MMQDQELLAILIEFALDNDHITPVPPDLKGELQRREKIRNERRHREEHRRQTTV